MTKLDIDTIGPIPKDSYQNQYIIVIIDAFSRYINLTACKDTTAASAAKALHTHACRFGFPLSITTDNGSQFMNEMFQSLTRIYGINHIRTIPYSKEENGIVERANKEVNRHLRNIIFDSNITNDWSDYLPLIEKLFNSSIKTPLGVSPNTIIFGNIIDTNTGFLTHIDEYIKQHPGQSIQKYISKLLLQQQQIIMAANKSLQTIEANDKTNSKLKKLQRQHKSKSHSVMKLDQHQHFLAHDYKVPNITTYPVLPSRLHDDTFYAHYRTNRYWVFTGLPHLQFICGKVLCYVTVASNTISRVWEVECQK